MSPAKVIFLILVAVAGILVYSAAYTVSEREQAIVRRVGKIVRTDAAPGLHFKLPVVEDVQIFEKRLLTLDSTPERVLTGEKKNVLVDYFVKWRIENAEEFYLAFGGDELKAASQLADIINNRLQVELNDRNIRQVVSDDRNVIMQNLATDANERIGKFGIHVVDVRIKQIELEKNVLDSVFARMSAERERIAREHRAMGEKESKIIHATADRKRVELLADARRKGEIIRGQGDAKATEIYAKAYGQDNEFYAFYKSLESYRNAFNSKQDVIVLDPDTEFFKYFGSSKSGK